MRTILFSIGFLLLTNSHSWAATFDFAKTPGRLPKTIAPVTYEIEITPNPEKLEILGRETIQLEVLRSTNRIQLNSLNQRFSEVMIDGMAAKSVVTKNDQQLTTIHLAKPISVGQHTLSFAFTGKIETGPMGLFLQRYKSKTGQNVSLLSTQFEATDARRMFPCWDEPAFRSRFQLTVNVPKQWKTVSNMPAVSEIEQGDLIKTTFAMTPKMPSYLLAFTSGDLGFVSGSAEGVDLKVWAAIGQEKEGLAALENTAQILQDYNAYFQIGYPISKMDSIAIPGGFSGAMENWGAISYNESKLLITPLSSRRQREVVFSIQAHEMAHQWFGDLVTMAWWDDLWLNESFASWMAAKETDHRHPEWQWQQRQDRAKESALFADSFAKSHPIAQKVTNELEAVSAFDPVITYDKGQAILKMLESYLGESIFQKGIADYMKAHQFSNGTTDDLWRSLSQASGKPIDSIAKNWVEKPGFPMITVKSKCSSDGKRTLHLSQERFLLDVSSNTSTSTLWKIPLNLSEGSLKQPSPFVMSGKNQKVPAGFCYTPLTLNENGIGYYRVLWDEPTFKDNLKAINQFSAANRINLLDDQWAFVLAHKSSLEKFMQLVQAIEIKDDVSVREWDVILASLEAIASAEIGKKNALPFNAKAIKILLPLAEKLGWEAKSGEPSVFAGLRAKVWLDLGLWGDSGAVKVAQDLFKTYLLNKGDLSPDLQLTVFKIIAKHATTEEFNQLVALTRQTNNVTELTRYFESLMFVGDEGLAKQALDMVLSSNFPTQLQHLQVDLVRQLSNQHPLLGWDAYQRHHNLLMKSQATFAPFMLANTPEFFWHAATVKELASWSQSKIAPSMKPTLKLSLDTAKFKQANQVWLRSQADQWLAQPTN